MLIPVDLAKEVGYRLPVFHIALAPSESIAVAIIAVSRLGPTMSRETLGESKDKISRDVIYQFSPP